MNKVLYIFLSYVLLIIGCSSNNSNLNNKTTDKLTKLGSLPNGAVLYIQKNIVAVTAGTSQQVSLSLVGGNNTDSYNIIFSNNQKQANGINGINVSPNSCLLSSGKNPVATCNITISASPTTSVGKYSISSIVKSTSTGRVTSLLPIVVLISGSTVADTKDITSFIVNDPNIPGVAYTATIDINTNNIAVIMPAITIFPKSLVANFVTNGSSITVGGIVQINGITANIFDPMNPTTYTVIAADGTTKNYIVTVTAAKSDIKDLSNFILAGEIGSTTVSGNNITVNLSRDTDFTQAIAASFTTMGVNVSVNGQKQISGDANIIFTPGTPVVYTVTAQDGTTQNYNVTITIHIPQLSIIGSDFSYPTGVVIDSTGNIYVANTGNDVNVINKISFDGKITIFGPGFKNPSGLAVDNSGNVYVSDRQSSSITKISSDGTQITTLGSNFKNSSGVAVDSFGNIYVADSGNNTITKMSSDGTQTTILGSGFNYPSGVAIDSSGNIYIADSGNNMIKKMNSEGTNIITLGSGFNYPSGIAVDNSGNVYVADTFNNAIKKINSNGTNITTIAGNGKSGAPTSGPATDSSLSNPFGVALGNTGDIYIADNGNSMIEKIK